MAGIQPYSFEPQITENDSNQEDEMPSVQEVRKGNITWCRCSECIPMQSDEESVCCAESQVINDLKGSADCITFHTSFNHVVLDIDTLNTARHVLMIRAISAYEREELGNNNNRNYRYVAYKQFVYWVNSWKPLGKHNRKVIPACVIGKIRSEYPENNGIYVNHKAVEGRDVSYFD